MSENLPQDARGFWMLPQGVEEAGYYTYGTPGQGAAQYSHAHMLNLIFFVEREWALLDERKFGVGNVSLANGRSFPPHRSHRSGREVDIRPIRKDGKREPVRYTDTQYDRDATRKLVDLFWRSGLVKRIGFNDLTIPRVQRMVGHDDHLHVEVSG